MSDAAVNQKGQTYEQWSAINRSACERVWQNTAAIIPMVEETVVSSNPIALTRRETVMRLIAHLYARLDK